MPLKEQKQTNRPDRPLAALFGCSGTSLSAEEKSFFKESNPLGFIIFSRNVKNPAQLKALIADLRETVGRENAPVLIDQEGGRVVRLSPPNWPAFPSAATYADIYKQDKKNGTDAARIGGQLIGHELHQLGITVDCAPVLDLPGPGADPIIGDRAFGTDVDTIVDLGRAFAEGLMDAGVAPVIKHIPGHGRALVDSHEKLPIVDATKDELEKDFAPFKELNYMAWAMTAHVVYTDIDSENPATFSAEIIENVIRKQIGFRGFLISDDLSMKALIGSTKERASRALAAGCDAVLHCNGDMGEMKEVASGCGQMSGPQWARFSLGNLQRHLAGVEDKEDESKIFDLAKAKNSFDELMAAENNSNG